MIGGHRNRRCGALRITVATEQKRSATLLLFTPSSPRFCVNRKCSLATLLTKGQIWRAERWEYRPATVHFRQSFACGAQVSPAARHSAPFSHALARGRLARRGGWRRRDGQLRWRCARLYLCLRAAEVAAGTAGTGHSGCAQREAGATANAGMSPFGSRASLLSPAVRCVRELLGVVATGLRGEYSWAVGLCHEGFAEIESAPV